MLMMMIQVLPRAHHPRSPLGALRCPAGSARAATAGTANARRRTRVRSSCPHCFYQGGASLSARAALTSTSARAGAGAGGCPSGARSGRSPGFPHCCAHSRSRYLSRWRRRVHLRVRRARAGVRPRQTRGGTAPTSCTALHRKVRTCMGSEEGEREHSLFAHCRIPPRLSSFLHAFRMITPAQY